MIDGRPMTREAMGEAVGHVYRQQHAGAHEQDRHDARVWLDTYADGRCGCDRCVRDDAKFMKGNP